MSGLRGNVENLRRLRSKLRKLPKVIAQNVASAVAPTITTKARGAYQGGQTVYGDPRPLGVDGNALTLHKTGRTLGALSFIAIGTIVRARLGTRYARYLIGKYRILPMGRLPISWSRAIADAVRSEVPKELAQ